MTDAIEKITKGQEVAADVAALLRARNPLIWIVTREEARVERLLIEAAAAEENGLQYYEAQAYNGEYLSKLVKEHGSSDSTDGEFSRAV